MTDNEHLEEMLKSTDLVYPDRRWVNQGIDWAAHLEDDQLVEITKICLVILGWRLLGKDPRMSYSEELKDYALRRVIKLIEEGAT